MRYFQDTPCRHAHSRRLTVLFDSRGERTSFGSRKGWKPGQFRASLCVLSPISTSDINVPGIRSGLEIRGTVKLESARDPANLPFKSDAVARKRLRTAPSHAELDALLNARLKNVREGSKLNLSLPAKSKFCSQSELSVSLVRWETCVPVT